MQITINILMANKLTVYLLKVINDQFGITN